MFVSVDEYIELLKGRDTDLTEELVARYMLI